MASIPTIRSHEWPLASVIIPTFNRAAFLAEAVESALAQEAGRVEVIIVDDGSTDGTADFVSELLAGRWKGAPVLYRRQENRGASAARNLGLSLARGEYVQFLDSDDVIFPRKISAQAELLEREEFSDAEVCSCYGLLGLSRSSAVRIGVCAASPYEFLLAMGSRLVHAMQTSAPLWRRAFLLEHEGWRTDIGFGDDLEFNARMLCRCRRTAFVGTELFWVREHDSERLSVIAGDARKVGSAILTRRLFVEHVRRAGLWDAAMQRATLSALRSLYAQAMAYLDRGEVARFESFYAASALRPVPRIDVLLLVLLRRVLGKRLLLAGHARILRPLAQIQGREPKLKP